MMIALARVALAAALLFTLAGCEALTRECHYYNPAAPSGSRNTFTILVSRDSPCDANPEGGAILVP